MRLGSSPTALLNKANNRIFAMPKNRIHATHPSFNAELFEQSKESTVAAFVECGDLSIDDQGQVWRHRKKVGGNHPRIIEIMPPVRAENVTTTGRHQIQVYVHGKRIACHAARLVWYCVNGEIPENHHIHHINSDYQDNRICNLQCIDGVKHIAAHGVGRIPVNKGTKYGKTPGYKKSHATRQSNYAKQCAETLSLQNDGFCATAISKIQGICRRQVYSRLQSIRTNDHLR